MYNSKNPIVILLLLHGIVLNLLLLPLAILFPDLVSEASIANQFHLKDWVNSVCINLFAWHLFYTVLKSRPFFKTPKRLRDELKRFSWIVQIENWLFKSIKDFPAKNTALLFLIGLVILVNIIVPIIFSTILGHKLAYRSLGLSFISIQFISFIAFYCYNKFPEETIGKDEPIPSPWLLEILFSKNQKKAKPNSTADQ